MKKAFISALVFAFGFACLGQEVVEKTIPYNGQELDVDFEIGEVISIKSWDKKEVYIKVTYEINDGELNEALRVDIDDYRDRVSLDIDLNDRMLKRSRYRGCGSRDGKRNYYSGDGYDLCADVEVEVYLPKESDLWINTVVADVEVEGMKGNIEIETVTGHIDVTWDKDSGADIKMKTVTGAVYTNFDLRTKRERGLNVISSKDIRSTYMSGGKEVNLETVTSDIYLRKSGE